MNSPTESPIMVSSPLSEQERLEVQNSLIRRMYEIHAAIGDLQAEHDHLHRRLLRLDTGWERSRPARGNLRFQRVFNTSPANWNEETPQGIYTTRSLLTPPPSPLWHRLRAASVESDTGNQLVRQHVNNMFGRQTHESENPFLLE